MLEAQPVPLQAALGPEMGGVFAHLHRRHGVDLRLGCGVVGVRENEDLPADTVIMAVGPRPSVELAERSGLAVNKGRAR